MTVSGHIGIPQAPPHIGRLLTAKEVADEIFRGNVTPRWVKETLKAGRARLGHNTVFWEEYTVKQFILDQVES